MNHPFTSNRLLRMLGKCWLAAVLVFLYAPIAVMAFMSFNASPYYQLPFEFSLTWYERLAGNRQMIDAAVAMPQRLRSKSPIQFAVKQRRPTSGNAYVGMRIRPAGF